MGRNKVFKRVHDAWIACWAGMHSSYRCSHMKLSVRARENASISCMARRDSRGALLQRGPLCSGGASR